MQLNQNKEEKCGGERWEGKVKEDGEKEVVGGKGAHHTSGATIEGEEGCREVLNLSSQRA